MKIGFYSQNFVVLKNYWSNLKNKFDCWWGVPEEKLYKKLLELNEKKFSYHCEPHIKNENIKDKNQFISTDSYNYQKKIAEEINPDLWIVDTPNLLNTLKKKVPKVQVFQSLPLKKHIFYEKNLDHDLILFPGNYHRDKFLETFKIKNDDEKFRVVGWPRVDDLINDKFNREKILKKLNLDPQKKTVMYAPTWGWGEGNNYLFCRWFDKETEIFEKLCKFVTEANLNFIVRLHSLSFKTNSKKLIEIAERYGVYWQTKETSNFQDDPNEFLYVTDILISDVSGIITEFLVLDRPIIYIDPENTKIWLDSDMPKNFRAGQIITNFEELLEAIKNSVKNPKEFSKMRLQISKIIYSNLNGKASIEASQEVVNFIEKKIIKK